MIRFDSKKEAVQEIELVLRRYDPVELGNDTHCIRFFGSYGSTHIMVVEFSEGKLIAEGVLGWYEGLGFIGKILDESKQKGFTSFKSSEMN